MALTQRQRNAVRTERQAALYTKRQCELIRTRVDAYYDLHHAAKNLSWEGLCDEIFDCTNTKVRSEDLRQWVEGFIQQGRKTPRHPNDDELEAVVAFLKDPAINMLSDKELNEPEIPYRFAQFLLDFLAHPRHTQLFPPKELGGRYVALLRFADGPSRRKVELKLEINPEDHVIRVSESSEVWSHKIDVKNSKVSRVLTATYTATGWAVITPEDNIFVFMKNARYGYNHYYFTIAVHPGIWSDTSACQLALLRHQYPVLGTADFSSFEDLIKETDGDTEMLLFKKITESNEGK